MDRDNRNRNNNGSASRPQPVMHTLDINSTIMQKHTKSTPDKDHQSSRNRPSTGSKSKISGEEFIVGKVSRPESAKSKRETTSSLGKSRPSSGKPIRAPVNTSSISAYLQLKRAGKLNLNDNIHSGAISTGKCKNDEPGGAVVQGSHRLEKYLNLAGFLDNSLKIKSALKSTGKSLKSLEKSLNSTLFCRT